nr:VOC family protein [uncultured Akkermansia sp.]
MTRFPLCLKSQQKMRIEHIALYVIDIEKTKDFFTQYFNAVPNELYHNQKTGFKSYFLSFDDGSRLEIMTRPELAEVEASHLRCGYIHIAISVGSKETVNELTGRLHSDGYEVVSGPRTTGDGCYESCIIGPENNLIEITV